MNAAVAAPTRLAVERPEINWPGYISWTIGMILVVVLLYWLMRRAWQRRGEAQGDLPPLPQVPAATGVVHLAATGRYHGSTTAGQWLDRIIARGLGTRSRADLSLTDEGLLVDRPGASSFFVPTARLHGARLDKAIAGKVLTEGGLLVITWEHGGRQLDSGFRFDQAGEHPAWVEAINAASVATTGTPAATSSADTSRAGDGAALPHHQEGAS
ncbi:hypothetical protein [Streptomyces spiramenti]|uniref:PH-like domain-containing protein n=1 Tax=Streptomyces spiramenti TaxID=2720606 RepID=UPI001FD7320A|nr:hypothetical protein [Streptomyces spiramenti]